MGEPDEQRVREGTLAQLEGDPERFLAEYSRQFGNVLNADNAATLFAEYRANPAKYRVAVHPAAQWIRDELFRRALVTVVPLKKNIIVFTAGGNAVGKTTAVAFARVGEDCVAILDSTFSNSQHSRRLIEQALDAGKSVTIIYVRRPLTESLEGMIGRARTEGRVVSIDQMIRSQQGAAETVLALWREFSGDPRFSFVFVDNGASGTRAVGVELARPEDYTESRLLLDQLLDKEYRAGRISGALHRRVSGRDAE